MYVREGLLKILGVSGMELWVLEEAPVVMENVLDSIEVFWKGLVKAWKDVKARVLGP